MCVCVCGGRGGTSNHLNYCTQIVQSTAQVIQDLSEAGSQLQVSSKSNSPSLICACSKFKFVENDDQSIKPFIGFCNLSIYMYDCIFCHKVCVTLVARSE